MKFFSRMVDHVTCLPWVPYNFSLLSFFDIFEQEIDNYQTKNGEEERKSCHTLFELIRS